MTAIAPITVAARERPSRRSPYWLGAAAAKV
jgi:hypothetical protein